MVLSRTKTWQSVKIAGLITLFLLATLVGFAAPTHALAANCHEVQIPVSLTIGGPANQTISGTLCQPSSWANGQHQIDVLVAGATYTRNYWDWPQNSPDYSYVSRTLQAGRATLAYDRIGTGKSSQPLGLVLSADSEAYNLHQIVQWTRKLPDTYTKITTIGHSYGSAIVMTEAGNYRDTDRMVVTGLIHALGSKVVQLGTAFYPAILDPQFAGTLDPGYLTTLPGVRGSLFYDMTSTDPAVVAYDEAHKSTVPALGLAAATSLVTPPPLTVSKNITAPTFTIVGSSDGLVCNLVVDCSTVANVQAHEAPYFPQAASVTSAVVAHTGHDLNLQTTANESFTKINDWIKTH